MCLNIQNKEVTIIVFIVIASHTNHKPQNAQTDSHNGIEICELDKNEANKIRISQSVSKKE